MARIYRLREADGEPMAIERAALPLDILPNPTRSTTSLYEVLERSPATARCARCRRSRPINLEAREAELLGVAEGAAGLRIERMTPTSPSGRVAEFTRSLYRGDAYDFVAELRF